MRNLPILQCTYYTVPFFDQGTYCNKHSINLYVTLSSTVHKLSMFGAVFHVYFCTFVLQLRERVRDLTASLYLKDAELQHCYAQ